MIEIVTLIDYWQTARGRYSVKTYTKLFYYPLWLIVADTLNTDGSNRSFYFRNK